MIKAGLCVISLLLTASPSRAQETNTQPGAELRSQLMSKMSAFAEKTKLDVDPDKLAYATIKKGLVATVPAKGVEKFDPKKSKEAFVDVGVVLLTAPIATSDGGREVPPGIYRARLVFPQGPAEARAELLDEQGKTVATAKQKAPSFGAAPRSNSPFVMRAVYEGVGANPAELPAAIRGGSPPGSAQYCGASWTRCYGFLLFCCESRDRFYNCETICRWCGFCFGFWF